MQTKNINIHIGNKLRTRRTTLGLSQGAVAKAMGMASQQVQKYEKGVNAMNAQRLYEFSKFLKVPVVYFFEGFDAPKNKTRKFSFAEDANEFEGQVAEASDRETIEILKSFKRIKDSSLRKRVADLLRTIALKDI